MGFGLSYALPIVVGGLVAAKDGLLIVENPEAHLHPQGQSNMGQFLAWLAGKGVQVIVETHFGSCAEWHPIGYRPRCIPFQ